MLKGSALYIVIIIALVIGLLCAALIVAAYFYKTEYQKKFRYEKLENNLSSGINILLAGADIPYSQEKTFSLFANDEDSVTLKRISWGLYDIGIVKAFSQRDTLFKILSIANSIDSTKWAALYLIDEDRPFSLSGKTTILGDAYIPKAGVQQAYVDNKAYTGDRRLIIGTRHTSDKKLPILDETKITELQHYFSQQANGRTLPKNDSVTASFLKPARVVNFKKQIQTVSDIYINGNVLLFSDTTLIIDSTAVLKNTLVFAKSIIVKSGFHGNCQLFATDSIKVEENCRFDYPSCLGLFRLQTPIVASQAKISIGENTIFNGIIFTYEKVESSVKPLISLMKKVKITGQVYAQGILELKDGVEIDGSAFTSRFLYQNSFTRFENYLINATIDAKALSPYYLTSGLMPVAAKQKKVLQWLEAN